MVHSLGWILAYTTSKNQTLDTLAAFSKASNDGWILALCF